jgi:predicted transcriptional regulator
MEASVKDYLDENGLEDMAALAKKYDVSKSSIQRYLSSCNKLMPNV